MSCYEADPVSRPLARKRRRRKVVGECESKSKGESESFTATVAGGLQHAGVCQAAREPAYSRIRLEVVY
jgi:hypothetical protein